MTSERSFLGRAAAQAARRDTPRRTRRRRRWCRPAARWLGAGQAHRSARGSPPAELHDDLAATRLAPGRGDLSGWSARSAICSSSSIVGKPKSASPRPSPATGGFVGALPQPRSVVAVEGHFAAAARTPRQGRASASRPSSGRIASEISENRQYVGLRGRRRRVIAVGQREHRASGAVLAPIGEAALAMLRRSLIA